jgi:hypothetical protein
VATSANHGHQAVHVSHPGKSVWENAIRLGDHRQINQLLRHVLHEQILRSGGVVDVELEEEAMYGHCLIRFHCLLRVPLLRELLLFLFEELGGGFFPISPPFPLLAFFFAPFSPFSSIFWGGKSFGWS